MRGTLLSRPSKPKAWHQPQQSMATNVSSTLEGKDFLITLKIPNHAKVPILNHSKCISSFKSICLVCLVLIPWLQQQKQENNKDENASAVPLLLDSISRQVDRARERECVSIEQCKSHAYSAIPQGIARGVYYELVVATILVGLE